MRADSLYQTSHRGVLWRRLNINPLVRRLVTRQEVTNRVRMRRPASAQNSNTFESRPERRHPIFQKIIEHGIEVFFGGIPWLQQVVMNSGVVDGANGRIGVGVSREQDAFGIRKQAHGLAEKFDSCHDRHSLVRKQ